MIGIIGAMDIEIELLKSDLQLKEKKERAQMVFYQGKLKGKDVVLVKSGIGKVNAAVCTQILVDDFSVDKVIFTGVAGAVDNNLDVGDIVISTDTIQHDVNATAMGYELGEIAEMNKIKFTADQNLIDLAKDAGEKLIEDGAEIKVVVGRVLSGDEFVADDEKVEWLKETFDGYCAEMEGAAVGQACFLNSIPFVIIRSMSDKADGSAEVDYSAFMDKAAKRSYRIVEEMLQHA